MELVESVERRVGCSIDSMDSTRNVWGVGSDRLPTLFLYLVLIGSSTFLWWNLLGCSHLRFLQYQLRLYFVSVVMELVE